MLTNFIQIKFVENRLLNLELDDFTRSFQPQWSRDSVTWTIVLFNSLLRLDIYNTDGCSTRKEGSGFDLLQSTMVLRSHIHMVSLYGEACASLLA